MTENKKNWLYPEASGLYFSHDGFVMRATDGKQYDIDDECELLNELHEENKQLKQFQQQVASVIESKMGDNVCNDYKMEVLKEIWNELELDEVWFE